MDVKIKMKSHTMIQAFYLFFIISGMQLGVGIMGAPRYIFQFADQDAWISILISFVFILITVAVMFIILNQYENTDIFGIQVDIFGKVFGKILGLIYIIYFGISLVSVLLTYIEVLQIFIYPTLPSFVAGLALLALITYTILGGIRVMVGVVFIFFLLTQGLLLLLYDPIISMEWGHFLPMFQTSIPNLMQGAKASAYTVAGFQILFLVYPFIENKEKAKLPIFLGIAYTSFILLLTTVISIGFYSLEGLENIEWSVITLFKSVSYSFIERIDYFVVVEWMMVVIPNNIFLMWGVTYGLKRLFNVSQRVSLYVASVILLIIISVVKYDVVILKVTDIVANASIWIIFVYPMILLPLVLIKKKINNRKRVGQ